jgi:beta-glucosidase
MHYDHKQSELLNANTWEENYYNPQWDFGFGLSYTTFEYSNMKLSSKTINSDNELLISIDIKNTGNIIGKEVVQLYIRDHYATISPSLKKLKRFIKIELKPSEVRTVNFTISSDDLKFFGIDNNWIVEEGKFSVIINELIKDFNFKK